MKRLIAASVLLFFISFPLLNNISIPGPATAQQKPKPTPTPVDPLGPGQCDCVADPCCYSPVSVCPTCCGGVPCKNLSDEEFKKFLGKQR